MKKQTIIPLALALLCSCGNNNGSSTGTDKESEGKPAKQTSAKKKLMINGDFNQITSLGGIDIIYQQGDFNIDIEGDSTLFQSVRADVESNVLTIYFSYDNNTDLNYYGNTRKITAHITSPDLKCVALCSTGSFKSEKKWKIEDITLGTIGSGNFDLDSIECNTFSYESTGEGNASFKHIDSKELIKITCMNETEVTADINTASLNVAAQKAKINLTGKAESKNITASASSLISDKTTK